MIYLDHNATTPVVPEVVDAMLPFYREYFGNASSVHAFGRDAKRGLEDARDAVADLLGADPTEIVFTGGGTEADNLAIRGVALAAGKAGGHIITSQVEHHAVLETCRALAERGHEVTELPVDEHGLVDPLAVREAIRENTILITIMHGNNEVGTIQPIAEIGQIAQEAGIPFHTDAVQAVGRVPIDVTELNVDLLSCSAHKLYGPKGVGALYIRAGTRIRPLAVGGHHEWKMRAGTENVPGTVGFGKAAEVAARDLVSENRRVAALRDRLQEGLLARIKEATPTGHPTKRLPNTLNMTFRYVEGEALLLSLDVKGVAVSTGSACTSGSLHASHVLLAMGIPHQLSQGALRFSLGRANSDQDIDDVLTILPEEVARLRAMSPLYREQSPGE